MSNDLDLKWYPGPVNPDGGNGSDPNEQTAARFGGESFSIIYTLPTGVSGSLTPGDVVKVTLGQNGVGILTFTGAVADDGVTVPVPVDGTLTQTLSGSFSLTAFDTSISKVIGEDAFVLKPNTYFAQAPAPTTLVGIIAGTGTGYIAIDLDGATFDGTTLTITGGGGGGGPVSFSAILGAPTDNTSLSAALAAKATMTALTAETSRAETAEALLVPKTTSVAGHALGGNVTIAASDLSNGVAGTGSIVLSHDSAGTPKLFISPVARTIYATDGSTPAVDVSNANGVGIGNGVVFVNNDGSEVDLSASLNMQSNPIDGVTDLSVETIEASGVITASGGVTGLPMPSATSDAATKVYVDNLSAGITWKQPVRLASTAAATLASAFAAGQSLDGFTLVLGDRILVKDQSAGAENGIYTVNASGAPTRSTDADTGAELYSATVFVEQGTANADKSWVCTNDSIVIGSTSIVFVKFGSAIGALLASNNLSDLVSASTSRTNLGLGTLATQSGTFSGTSSGTNTGDQTITLTGDATGSGTGSFAATLANTAVTAGSYVLGSFTVDAKGRLTAASNGSTITVSQGGTGLTSATSYAPIFGGTSGTGALQSGTAGTAGQVLTSNGPSALPTFQAATGGTPFHIGRASGNYFVTYGGQVSGTVAMAANLIIAQPFFIPTTVTITKVGIEVTSTGGAGKLIRLGIYANGTGIPGSLILDAGTVAADSVAAQEITISQSLTPGWYWMVATSNGTPTCRSVGVGATDIQSMLGNPSSVSSYGSLNSSSTFAALPGSFPTVTYSSVLSLPLIWTRN